MKRALFQIINLLMVCIVLVTSTGFGLIEHSCLMRGKKISLALQQEKQQNCSLHAQKGSSETQSTDLPVIKKTECCQESQRYENVDFSSSISQLVAKFIKSVTNVALEGMKAAFVWLLDALFLVEKDQSTVAVSTSPPLPYGRTLLSFVQSFLL